MRGKIIFSFIVLFIFIVPVFKYSYADEILVGADKYSVRWVAKDDFSNADWESRWYAEPDTLCVVSKEKLILKGTGTIWFKQELPPNIFIHYITQGLSGKKNFNNFFSAKEQDDIEVQIGKRKGQYTSYFNMNLYAITFTPGWSRLWRGPDRGKIKDETEKFIKSEFLDGRKGFQGSQNNITYDVVISVVNGRIRYYLDGKKWHDWTDPMPHKGGKYAIRTWATNAVWDDFEFAEIILDN